MYATSHCDATEAITGKLERRRRKTQPSTPRTAATARGITSRAARTRFTPAALYTAGARVSTRNTLTLQHILAYHSVMGAPR